MQLKWVELLEREDSWLNLLSVYKGLKQNLKINLLSNMEGWRCCLKLTRSSSLIHLPRNLMCTKDVGLKSKLWHYEAYFKRFNLWVNKWNIKLLRCRPNSMKTWKNALLTFKSWVWSWTKTFFFNIKAIEGWSNRWHVVILDQPSLFKHQTLCQSIHVTKFDYSKSIAMIYMFFHL